MVESMINEIYRNNTNILVDQVNPHGYDKITKRFDWSHETPQEAT